VLLQGARSIARRRSWRTVISPPRGKNDDEAYDRKQQWPLRHRLALLFIVMLDRDAFGIRSREKPYGLLIARIRADHSSFRVLCLCSILRAGESTMRGPLPRLSRYVAADKVSRFL
jgi:hypothetical protein